MGAGAPAPERGVDQVGVSTYTSTYASTLDICYGLSPQKVVENQIGASNSLSSRDNSTVCIFQNKILVHLHASAAKPI